MKFCKWIIEKNNHFIELNRTSFLILWHCGAIWYVYNGYFKNIVYDIIFPITGTTELLDETRSAERST
ncbi:hypothetical protein [Spiroplasma endosymbiont of Agriotes lineatus]|uniref:hypothetical protein n=1 Tax=Spiroplasma endosymbiont of Agriotes lineatus TaxID=3077930 RepID=UPI0030CA8363